MAFAFRIFSTILIWALILSTIGHGNYYITKIEGYRITGDKLTCKYISILKQRSFTSPVKFTCRTINNQHLITSATIQVVGSPSASVTLVRGGVGKNSVDIKIAPTSSKISSDDDFFFYQLEVYSKQ